MIPLFMPKQDIQGIKHWDIYMTECISKMHIIDLHPGVGKLHGDVENNR